MKATGAEICVLVTASKPKIVIFWGNISNSYRNVTMERLFRKELSQIVFTLPFCCSPAWSTIHSWFYESLLQHIWIKNTGVLWLRKFILIAKNKIWEDYDSKAKRDCKKKIYRNIYMFNVVIIKICLITMDTSHHQMQWQLLRSWIKFDLNRLLLQACMFLVYCDVLGAEVQFLLVCP